MRRLILFLIFAAVGAGLLVAGLFVPVHLRAVDAKVLREAGNRTPSLADLGIALAAESKIGPAQMVLQTAESQKLDGVDKLRSAVDGLTRQHSRWEVWGGPEPRFESIFEPDKRLPESGSQPFTQYVIRESNRERVLAQLQNNPDNIIRALLQLRGATNTAIFSPSQSASGQALDAAISICGLLVENRYFSQSFRQGLARHAGEALIAGHSVRLEQALLDLASLGQRLNWGQLVEFVSEVPDPETLRLLVRLLRQDESRLPLLFSSVLLSGDPAGVTDYLMSFSQSGWRDLGASLRYGKGGVVELIRREQRVHFSRWANQILLGTAVQIPWLAQTAKWLMYLAGGFMLAIALHFARPAVPNLERPLQVRGMHVARELLFALGFLVLVLLLSEPFLSQDSQRLNFPLQIRLPTPNAAVSATLNNNHPQAKIMNQLSLLTLLLFFVLQSLLYVACLVKLAEIRRQNVAPRIKLRLLDNEDHLFDAGLYLGFVGTIISLILVSLGVIKPSLMAAYSSTSFGIIFVSFFKIVNLRPTRRKLLMEAEVQASQMAARGQAPSMVTP